MKEEGTDVEEDAKSVLLLLTQDELIVCLLPISAVDEDFVLVISARRVLTTASRSASH